MELATKIKTGIAVMGLAGLLGGCIKSPLNEETSSAYVPKECVEVKMLTQTSYGWDLLCTNAEKEEIYFRIDSNSGWKRYSVERIP